jgi:hypothetical protein
VLALVVGVYSGFWILDANCSVDGCGAQSPT